MIVYHGTSFENGQKILNEGFMPKKSNWYVSDSQSVYFAYSEDKIEAKNIAIDNGKIAAALSHSTSPHIMLFSIEVNDDEIEEFRDYSCEGMSEIALEMPVDTIINKKLNYEIIENSFIPNLGLMYLFPLAHNQYLNTDNLSQNEYDILSNLPRILGL